MNNGQHVLVSLESRHAENILSGTKRVELRRRKMHIEKGTTVWLYVKQPVAAIIGKATVNTLCSLEPDLLWKKFSSTSGLTREEFFGYFAGVTEGFALGLSAPERLKAPLHLKDLRKVAPGFQPPQFFKRFDSRSTVLKLVQNGQPKEGRALVRRSA